MDKKLLKLIRNTPSILVRECWQKRWVNKKYHWENQRRDNVKFCRKQKTPKRRVKWQTTAITRSKLFGCLLIDKLTIKIVGETYFKHDFATLPRNQYVNTTNKSGIPHAKYSIWIENLKSNFYSMQIAIVALSAPILCMRAAYIPCRYYRVFTKMLLAIPKETSR